jgi:two-component system sensor histidine kinase KdpD
VDAATQRRVADSLALAHQLDGIPLTFQGPDFPAAVAAFVKEYGITHVLVGRSLRPWYRRVFGPSILDQLVRAVPGVDVVVVDTAGL